jgi:predicted nucleic acid-binding protein
VFSVVLDTCVLYSAPLRDSLLWMALDGLFRPLWTDDILDELVRVLPKNVSDEGRQRIRALMEEHFSDANVQGYSPLIPAMTNHEGDRHVLAAGVRANAGAIATFDLKDFDAASQEPYSIDLLHPDQFLVNQLGLGRGQHGITAGREAVHELVQRLERAGEQVDRHRGAARARAPILPQICPRSVSATDRS